MSVVALSEWFLVYEGEVIEQDFIQKVHTFMSIGNLIVPIPGNHFVSAEKNIYEHGTGNFRF